MQPDASSKTRNSASVGSSGVLNADFFLILLDDAADATAGAGDRLDDEADVFTGGTEVCARSPEDLASIEPFS